MSHNSAAGHWFKLGSLTAGGASVILARGCRAKNPVSFWLKRNRSASGTTTCTSWPVSQERSIPALPNDLERRVFERKEGTPGSFTGRYRVNRLVYYEEFSDINQVIAREKEIKNITRKQKIKLLESINPQWRDLSQQ